MLECTVPIQTKYLYPRGLDEFGLTISNTSLVEIEGNNERYPLFYEANYHEFILEPGDCLFIPQGWWALC